MAKTIETRYIIRGEDQVTPVSQRIERGWDKVNAALQESGKAPVLDTAYWDRISGVVRETTREYEKLAAAAKSVAKETANIGPGLGRGMRPLPPGVVLKGGTTGTTPKWERGAAPTGYDTRTAPGGGGGPPAGPGRPGGPGGGPWEGAPPEMANKWRLTWGQMTGQIPIGPNEPGGPGVPPGRRGGGGGGGGGGFGINRILGAGPQAIQAVSGGTPGILGGIAQGGSMLAQAGLAGLGMGAIVGGAALSVVAAGALAAHHLAQPALAIQNLQQPLRIRMGGQRVAAAREYGAKYGYAPEETLHTLQSMERQGSQAGFEAMARLRLQTGIEPETAAQLAGTVTAAGGVQPGDIAGYERFAKLIAVAIADKTKLPSVPQYLEQLNSLMQLSTNYLSDITEDDTQTLAAMAKWQETSGTSLLRGPRGAQTMAGVAKWVGGTEDPAAKAMIYQALQNDPAFQAEANARIQKDVAAGKYFAPQSEWWRSELQRNQPGAWMPALSGVTKQYGGNKDLGAYMLSKELGMSPEHAATLFKVGSQYKGDIGKIKAGFKTETGKDLEQILKPQDEQEMRRRQAEIAETQLKIAQDLAPVVMQLNTSVTELLVVSTPVLQALGVAALVLIEAAKYLHPILGPISAAKLGAAAVGERFAHTYGKDELKSGTGGVPQAPM